MHETIYREIGDIFALSDFTSFFMFRLNQAI